MLFRSLNHVLVIEGVDETFSNKLTSAHQRALLADALEILDKVHEAQVEMKVDKKLGFVPPDDDASIA